MNDRTPAAGAAPQENKMGVMPVGKLLAGMAVPMMISMLVQAMYNVVDSVFVSRISENALNAVSLAFPLQNLMIAVGAGTAVGINALLSRSLGEKRQDMADRAAGTGIFLSLCNAVVFAFIGVFLSRAFFMAQAKSVPEIVEMGTAYTRICLGLSVGLFCLYHVWQYAVAYQDPVMLLYALEYIPITLAITWSYERSGSLWTAIAFHAANNLMNFMVIEAIM